MKKLSFILFTAILILTFVSCGKDSDTDGNKDFYYVKYQISGKVYFYIDGVAYNTETGSNSESFSAARSFEQICGPVTEGFVAKIKLTQHRGEASSNATTISISKNNGPFAIKASGQYSATYVIDF